MYRSAHITAGVLLAIVPALSGVAAPIQSRVDVEQLCFYSQARQSPFAGTVADAGGESPFGASMAAPVSVQSVRGSGTAIGRARDPLPAALEARDYVEERGRVVMRDYEMKFDSNSFRFLPYDADVGLLGLQFAPRAPLFGGLAHAVWTEESQALYFEVSAEQAEELEALRSARALSVSARVQLSARDAPQHSFCERDEHGRPLLELLLLDGTLIATSNRQVLGTAVTDRYDRARCDRPTATNSQGRTDDTTPIVRATELASVGETSLTDVEGAMIRLLAETELHTCYMDALRNNAALRGALVVEFSMDARGKLANAGVLIDATNNPTLTRCTIGALDAARVMRGSDATALNVRMNLSFTRR